jgi:alkanesulfonate monooxygenase SsuD/methylene tetrahydromethanopterin reductase-like flavin-dependent oxidoreductase (luciferase family)
MKKTQSDTVEDRFLEGKVAMLRTALAWLTTSMIAANPEMREVIIQWTASAKRGLVEDLNSDRDFTLGASCIVADMEEAVRRWDDANAFIHPQIDILN